MQLASIIVPAFNEGAHLAHNLATLTRYLSSVECNYLFEIIVVDDGSTDETYAIAQTLARTANPNIRVLRHSANRGLGCAIRTGFGAAAGSVAIVYDSDLSYAPDIIPRLLAKLDSDNSDLVLASPYMRGGRVENVPLVRRILSREGNRFLSFATSGRYATITCMVRAYRLSFFRRIESTEERMEINLELFFRALAAGARVSEIPAVLRWSAERVQRRSRMHPAGTANQIARTMRYGIAHRPAILLAIPSLIPGLLPFIVGVAALLRLPVATIAEVTFVTVVVQYTSLAFFAGQIAVFGKNAIRTRS